MAKKTKHMVGANVNLLQSFVMSNKTDTGATNSNARDPFESMYEADNLVRPLYTPLSLAQMPANSTTLSTCIRAMATNIDGFGWQLVERPKSETDKEETSDDSVQSEQRELDSILNYINPDEDLTTLRSKLRMDIEACGYGMLEVVYDKEGKPRELYLLPAHSMRISKQDNEFTDFEQPVRGADGKYTPQARRKKFRRYVQVLEGSRKIYFKEFWDSREIDSKTGKPMSDVETLAYKSGAEGASVPANRILFFNNHCQYSIYGLPRWIPNLLGIIGAHKADEINLLYFDNKSIPPMVVTVSGGHLTIDSLKRLKETFEHQLKGVDNFHKCLVIEAIPESTGEGLEGEKVPPVRIEFKPLTQFIQDDALFMEYGKNGDERIRSAFQLPPIYIGKADDYTRATAMESARIAEQQVFSPERKKFDYIFNRTMMAALEINFWNFESLGTKTTDDAAIIEAMAKVKEALTIGSIMEAVADMRGEQIGEIPEIFYTMPLGMMNTMNTGANTEGDENNMPPQDQQLKKAVVFLQSVHKSLAEKMKELQAA